MQDLEITLVLSGGFRAVRIIVLCDVHACYMCVYYVPHIKFYKKNTKGTEKFLHGYKEEEAPQECMGSPPLAEERGFP